MSIRAALRQQLSATFSGRVYASELPDNIVHVASAFPAATVSQSNRVETYSHAGSSGYTTARIQITIWAKSHPDVTAKAAEVRQELEGWFGTMAGLVTVESCFLDGEDADWSDPGDGRALWIIRQDWSVSYLAEVDPDAPAGGPSTAVSAPVDQAMRRMLLASVEVGAIAGTRVYITRAPDNRLPAATGFPAVVIHQVSREPTYSQDGCSGYAELRLTVHSWAMTWDGARQLADAVLAVVDGYRGPMPAVGSDRVQVESCFLDDEDDDIDDPGDGRSLYLVRQDLLVSVLEDDVAPGAGAFKP